MRLGLAGTGRIGAFHAETLRQLADVVVADADPARARQTADKLGVEFAADVDALFAARLDGLVVATATDAHPELILRAVAAGLPVFSEKPVAGDVEGTLRVVDRIAASDVPVQIGFQRRFDAGYTNAREAVAAGRLGWIHTLRATTCDPAPPPAEYIATSGGFFRDCSVHDFDIIRWVTGREVVDAAGYDVRLEVLGAQGNLVVGLDDGVPLRSAEPGVTWPVGRAYPGFMERFRTAYETELAAFASLIAGQLTESPCGALDALEAFYIAEACDVSRSEHRPVQLAEIRR